MVVLLKDNKGFTLIELLIVVSIIGILAVALVPSITGASARARDAARVSGAKDLIQAIESFNIDQGRYPAGAFCVGDIDEDIRGVTADEALLISTYLNGDDLAQPSTVPSEAYEVYCDGLIDGYYLYYKPTTMNGYRIYYYVEKNIDGDTQITADPDRFMRMIDRL